MAEQKALEAVHENPFVGKFQSFLESQCKKQIEKLVEHYPDKKSLFIDFTELEHFDFELADELLRNSDAVLAAAEEAMQGIDVPTLELDEFKPYIRVFNLPKDSLVILRDIGSKHLSKLISVEGVVRQITDVLPKLRMAVWECRRCGNTYRLLQSTQKTAEPSICECKHRDFSLKADDSEFVDYQKILVQEPLELLKGSEQATNMEVYASEDMVNKVYPGARTVITGMLRLRPPKEKNAVYGRFIEAIHLEETAREFDELEISKEEEEEIKKLAANKNIYQMLIQSIAPNIYGHEAVKEAIALQLFGGVKKILPGENKIRGNIHVLLVGEPGLAKSAILLAVNKIAPKGIYIAGKTATCAGISATAVKDEFGEGGWTLKAGALVLASGGICMVDELDKMDPEDRSALHEAAEQESVSVAKAGIVARFKSETSILAAANPKYSRFDPYQNFIEQINLPASLLSRFDVFFLIRDVLDKKKDEEIASHILRTHQVGEMMRQQKKQGTKSSSAEIEEMKKRITPLIDAEMLKKVISYARQNCFPVMSGETIDAITEFYVNLREQGRKEGTYTATHRQLEALVRMSEASARVRLSNEVELQDTDRAIRIFRTSLEQLVTDQETGKIDFDLITTGQSHVVVENLRKVLNIIKGKASELDMVPLEEVREEAKTLGIDEEKTNEIVSKLEKAGDIYRPRHGFVKPTQKK